MIQVNKKLLLVGAGVYDAYLEPKGVKAYSYKGKDGKEHSGYQYDFDMSFPKK